MIKDVELAIGDTVFGRACFALLIGLHIIACCVSLAYLSNYPGFFIYYDNALLKGAIIAVGALSVLTGLFLRARFSFGYFVGFYFYTMILGYIWLNCFSRFDYNHWVSGASAVVSLIVFLIPALFVTAPVPQLLAIPAPSFNRFMIAVMLVGVATILVGASYSFKPVSLSHMYDFRDKVSMPGILRYWIGIVSNSLLPFAFACFVLLKRYRLACLTLVLLLLFYPITLDKIAFFTPVWLLTMAVLSRLFGCRPTVVLTLFLPLLIGVVGYMIFGPASRSYFELVNLRMIATPSNAVDIYNDFFFHHPHTFFCQIRLLKTFVSCPYEGELGVVMSKVYTNLGNFNASLFSTEGIASVGPLWAPVPILACGLVVALANRLSSGLPSRLVLISSAVLPQILLNVPLTTTLLSHGAAFLFLLWYLTPRAIFPPEAPLLRSPSKTRAHPSTEHEKSA